MRVAALHDDSTQHQISQQALAALGHDCHRFDSSVALLRALRRESFDLLLIDWSLPDFSGLEVLRWARVQLKERVPVLFITESRNEADVIEGLAAGADDFMVKPVRTDELGARINALLRRSYHRQQEADLVFGRYTLEPATRRALDRRRGGRAQAEGIRPGAVPVPEPRPPALARTPAAGGVGL